jgi:predicted MFS family arabinose efflux permease
LPLGCSLSSQARADNPKDTMRIQTNEQPQTAGMSAGKASTIFLVLAFAYFLSTLIRAITATLAPTLVEELGLNASQLGLLAGGYFLGFASTQLPLGAWLDRYGPKRLEIGFLLVAVTACMAFSMANSFVTLLLARVLCGVGVSACLMAPLTGYRRWYAPANQMRASSWMLMVGALGMVASTLPVQWLLPLIGWRSIFVMLAIGVALAMVLIGWQLPAWQQRPASAKCGGTNSLMESYAGVWRHPFFRRMAPLGMINYGGLVAMQTLWAAPWMVKVAGYSPAEAANGLFWINISMLLAYWLWGLANPWLAGKGYSAEKLIAGIVPLSLGLLLLLVVAGPSLGTASTLVWVLFCVSSTVCGMAQPAVGMAFETDLAGRALSAYNLLIFSGVFIVQWCVGLVVDALRTWGAGQALAYQGAVGVYGLCSLLSYLYFLRAKQP